MTILKRQAQMIKKNISKIVIGLGLITITALFLFNNNESNGDIGSISNSESFRKSQKLMKLIKEQKQENTSNERLEKDSANLIQQPAQIHNPVELITPDSEVLEKSQNFFAKIPRIHSLEGKTNADVHDIPAEALEAGEHLAQMREFFVTNPQPLAVETGFYLECSQQKDFFESVKAICAARVSELYTKKTGRKISPLVFDKRTAVLKEKVTL
jgi:hypothetical protein